MYKLYHGHTAQRAFENRISMDPDINYPYALLGKDLRLLSLHLYRSHVVHIFEGINKQQYHGKSYITVTNNKYEIL